MAKIPAKVKSMLKSYYLYTERAEKVRREIEKYFMSIGVDTDTDSCDLTGGMIQDIIIDTGMEGNIDRAVELIESVLEGRELEYILWYQESIGKEFYTGKCYIFQGQYYPSITHDEDKAKKYTSRKRAEKALETVVRKTGQDFKVVMYDKERGVISNDTE